MSKPSARRLRHSSPGKSGTGGRGPRGKLPDPIIETFRQIRIAANISQQELADRSGYGRDLICDWERGAVVPGLLRFREICQAIGLRIVLEKTHEYSL